jgi:hypothetical protein
MNKVVYNVVQKLDGQIMDLASFIGEEKTALKKAQDFFKQKVVECVNYPQLPTDGDNIQKWENIFHLSDYNNEYSYMSFDEKKVEFLKFCVEQDYYGYDYDQHFEVELVKSSLVVEDND